MGKMTEKQRRFADEYIRLGEITQAAMNAGYSTKTAYAIGQENLTKPIIKAYVDKRLDELKKESIAEQDEILQYLTSVMRGQEVEQFPLGAGMGEQRLVEKRLDGKERIKAAEQLGKRYGMWTEKQEIEHSGAVLFVDDIGDEDES